MGECTRVAYWVKCNETTMMEVSPEEIVEWHENGFFPVIAIHPADS